MHPPDDAAIAQAILDLTAARGPEKSICPSEAAMALAQDWRPLLRHVREVAASLARARQIDILRKGRAIDPSAMHGVIRLRARPGGDEVGETR